MRFLFGKVLGLLYCKQPGTTTRVEPELRTPPDHLRQVRQVFLDRLGNGLCVDVAGPQRHLLSFAAEQHPLVGSQTGLGVFPLIGAAPAAQLV